MADKSAQADIRGLDIDKLAKGFADEAFILKKFVRNSKTSSREIRWYTKTAGVLDSVDTTGITASQIANTSSKSLPVVQEPSYTRQQSFVRKYFVEGPWVSNEDIADSDIDVFGTMTRDLVRAVANQVDVRIYNVVSDKVTNPGDGGNVQTGAATADGWDDVATGDPITDIMAGLEAIRDYSYKTDNVVMYMHQSDHKNLLTYLINVKGSSIPNFSSERVKDGVVMELLGCKVVVSNNATADYVMMFLPGVSGAWKSFKEMSSAVLDDPGIGKKIRVWTLGEAILEEPKSVYVISDTQV